MATSNDWFQGAIQQIKDISKPPMTKQEAITYFQEKYDGKGAGGWKQQLIHQLLPFTKQTGKDPAKNLAKRFDPQRLHNPEPRNAAEYRALGLSIGYQPPKYGYHINCECWIKFSETCAHRTIDADVVGEWATELTANPALFQRAMLLLYMEEDEQDKEIDEQQPSVGLCESGDSGEDGEAVHDPDISITANEKETHSGHSGQRRRFSFFR